MAEDVQPMTLQQRIAALNASHLNRSPVDRQPEPQIRPTRPIFAKRHVSANNFPERNSGSIADSTDINLPNGRSCEKLPSPPIIQSGPNESKPAPPPLPTRQSSQPLPALPPRRPPGLPPGNDFRRTSSESISSIPSSVTGTSVAPRAPDPGSKYRVSSCGRIKAPAWGDCKLPPLPDAQRRFSTDKPCRALSEEAISQHAIEEQPKAALPPLPPQIPARRLTDHFADLSLPPDAVRNVRPVPSASALDKIKRSVMSFGMGGNGPPPLPNCRPTTSGIRANTGLFMIRPPTIPIASRPSLSDIQGCKPRRVSMTNGKDSTLAPIATQCMVCRDFSAPDHHATLFPRQHVRDLPSLGQQLTSPFPSATDKARAIFTWLHYNISYDTQSFFAGNLQASTPNSTLLSGLAVCEGYAALFTTLATHAGLESVVISGHGKGYGYSPLPPHAPLPRYNAGHAWNAVRIDNGEWKLVDACWGAGHVQGPGKPYVQRFEPRYFTMSNEEFGIKHFPGNKGMFFLPQGGEIEWEEYIRINPAWWPGTVEPPTIFSDAGSDYGVGERTVMPRSKALRPAQDGIIRFSFGLQCPHWTLDRHTKKGPPPVFILAVHGVDGRANDYLPLEHVPGDEPGEGGDMWLVDVEARRLGAPGQTLTLFVVRSFGEMKDARGLSVGAFREGKGKVGMAFHGVAAWDLIG